MATLKITATGNGGLNINTEELLTNALSGGQVTRIQELAEDFNSQLFKANEPIHYNGKAHPDHEVSGNEKVQSFLQELWLITGGVILNVELYLGPHGRNL